MTTACVSTPNPLAPQVGPWLQAGGTGLDCAWDYFNQPKVAEAITASGVPRSSIFITTKVCVRVCATSDGAALSLTSHVKSIVKVCFSTAPRIHERCSLSELDIVHPLDIIREPIVFVQVYVYDKSSYHVHGRGPGGVLLSLRPLIVCDRPLHHVMPKCRFRALAIQWQ